MKILLLPMWQGLLSCLLQAVQRKHCQYSQANLQSGFSPDFLDRGKGTTYSLTGHAVQYFVQPFGQKGLG